ncbi:UNVERIFIED_CONTAM: hypothetical protein GTU68_005252 [Idotea baltica]|nr:hypothetical protein [Idotea baltica]
MRYSTLGGGKRVRALLVYAAGSALNAPFNKLDTVAAALECIHSYSLIHDDLPAMDDDDLRRGKATNHKQFDEATAILAGDGLLTLAFELINSKKSGLTDSQAREISYTLSQCAGPSGMVGGQMLDIKATSTPLTQAQLENMHRCKTGALIRAAVICGALCADSYNQEKISQLTKYADNIGLAFQVVDDILDIESSTEQLGKTSGADQNLGKSTYPSILGLEKSKLLAKNLYQEAIASISSISDNTELLEALAKLVVNRDK